MTHPHRLESSFLFYPGTYVCIAHVPTAVTTYVAVRTLWATSREVQFKSMDLLKSLNDYSLLVCNPIHSSVAPHQLATAQVATVIYVCVYIFLRTSLFSAPLLDSSPLVTKMAAPSNAVKLKSHSSSSGEKQGGCCCHGKTILSLMRVF